MGEESRERAGRSESARGERVEVWVGRIEEREWIRERALETDSHHECIGSLVLVILLGLLLVAVLVVTEEEDELELEEHCGDDELLLLLLRW